MRVKPYVARARSSIQVAAKAVVYQDGPVCGLKFFSEKENLLLHDTGLIFRGRDPYAMAQRGGHFVLSGERLSGGRDGL